MVEKKCEHCGKNFNAKNNKQKFCSKECREGLIICAECEKESRRHYTNLKGEYICSTCYENKYRPEAPLVICNICGKEHKKNRTFDNKYICNSCYYEICIPLVICAECGKEHKKNSKNPKGEYICSSCYEKYIPLVICAECGKEHKKDHKNPKGEYICNSCYYEKYIPLVICAECGKEHKKDHKNYNEEYICASCYMTQLCKEIIFNNEKYYDFKNEDEISLFLFDMKKKYSHARIYRQLECELLGYGNYNEAMNQAEKRDNYTCQITGKKGNVVVHHLYSYNTHKELACDLNNLILLDKDFHNFFHDTCGRGNNTPEQFWNFVTEWKRTFITLDDFMEG